MTHISHDLDRICKGYCPICDQCPSEHECGNRIKIRSLIWKIMGDKNED